MNSAWILQDVVYVVALLAIGYPLGCYIYKIYNGEQVALMRVFAPLEQLLYRVMGVDEEQQMHAKKYASSVLWFSFFGFLIVMGLHLVQAWLPLNPEQLENTSLHLAYNTAASNGSVNAMHDSLTPLGGMITMFLMQLGEVVFGGVGCGLYGMLAFALLTVFMAGLMVGRTPEYIGKKINAFDMKMVCIILLVPPLCLLLATAITTLFPAAQQLQADGGWLSNTGSHGFSEILYAYTSMAGNNGSAFAGFQANTVLTNVMGGTVMLLVRFLPMVAVIYLAQSLASKKYVPAGSGTLATTSPLFVGFLIVIVLIVGALTFLPVLALGPLAEFFTQLHVLG